MTLKKLLCLGLVSWASIAQGQLKSWTENDKMEIMRGLDSTKQSLLTLVQPLSEKQFSYRADSTAWSVNDLLEHISLLEEGYIREFWWALAQPDMPASYQDSTKGGDAVARAYATNPNKSQARGTNIPLQRYCDKSTCVRVFIEARKLSTDFFIQNKDLNMRAFYVFRKSAAGKRDIRDLDQQGLWMLAHCVRHTNQIRRVIADPKFPKS